MNAHPTSKPCPHGPTPSLSTALQIPQYVIAVPIRGDGRQLAVASPAYLERHGTPAHPRELATRRCVGWRTAPSVAPYRWEFEEAGKEFSVTVADTITTTGMALRSEEHTSELQSLMRISYAVLCLKKKTNKQKY